MTDFVGALTKLSEVLMPSGTMLPFAGKSVPDGWLLCNGAAVSRTTYADLFAAIGTAWGTGDGSTTFNLPNCDSRFMEGTTDASKVGTYLAAGLPNITGTQQIHCWAVSANSSGAFSHRDNGNYVPEGKTDKNGYWTFVFDASSSDAHYGNSAVVQPSSYQTLIIIKV